MHKGVILTLVLLLGAAYAVNPVAELTAEPQAVKFYYGLPGSADYVSGTLPPGTPTDAWAQHSLLPAMLMDNAACATATHVYAVSGYNASNPRILASLANGSTTWETKAQPPIELSNAGIAALGDTLYYCSGYSYGTGGVLDTVMKYSISGNSWTTAPGPFTGTTYNWQPFILACAGKVYYISGCNAPGATNPTTQVWAYTPGSGWAQVASLNQGRVFAAGWVHNDTIWMAGGYQNTTVLAHTEFYDPVANVWTVDNTKFPPLPVGRWGAGSGVVGNVAYVAGGVSPAGALSDSIFYFDHSTSSWTVDRPLALAVYRTAGAGSADGKAFVIGGSTGGFTPTNVVQFEQMSTGNANDVGVSAILAPTGTIAPGNVTPRVTVRNFGTDPQSNIPVHIVIDDAGTPVYTANLTHPGPLAPGASANVDFSPQWNAPQGNFGVTSWTLLAGDQNPANDTARGTVNVVSAVWEPIAVPGTVPDKIVHVTVYDPGTDQVFQIGGCPAGQSNTYDGINRAYDPATDVWTTKAPMPTPLGWMGYGLVDGKIYCIGGHNNAGGFVATNQEYDIATNTWTTKAARPGTAVAAPLSATWNDELIYIMGGLATSAVTRVDIYDPATNTWQTGTALPQGAYMGSAEIIGDTIYIAQAYNTACWTHFYKGAINPSNPSQITWTQGPALTSPVFNGATVAIGQDVYWMGGFINATTATNRVWKYNQVTGAITDFTPVYPIINTRCTFAAARVTTDAQEIYGMAGDMGGDWAAPNRTYTKLTLSGVGVEETPEPLRAAIESVRPSVVRDRAVVSYSVSRAGQVNLGVYDVTGKLVRTLVDGQVLPGAQTATWNRTDDNGRRVSNGTYFYRLTVDGRTFSAKSVVLN
ncbi:MAG: FlgD immunoglobulin-like domain containing protein [bacterium]